MPIFKEKKTSFVNLYMTLSIVVAVVWKGTEKPRDILSINDYKETGTQCGVEKNIRAEGWAGWIRITVELVGWLIKGKGM